MLGWFQKLLPREEKFFDLFQQHSEVVVKGAEALRALLDGGEGVPRHYQTIMDREQDADNITREVLITVRRTFITPFDRSDIKDLITSMDNAIDQMQKTAKGRDAVRPARVHALHARDGRRDRQMRRAGARGDAAA
jgi:uncharacterized protein Yka (UPF0111/DUF47 family)